MEERMKPMKSVPFDPNWDLAPIPFEARHVELAKELKRLEIVLTPRSLWAERRKANRRIWRKTRQGCAKQ